MDSNTNTLLLIFVAFTGISVLLQACVLLGIYISLRKTAQSVSKVTEDLKATVIPMVHSTRELLERVSPQVATVTSGLAELTDMLRKESKGVSFSVSQIMERVERQTQRLDAMLTTGLNTVEKAGMALETVVAAPVRQANGIFAAIKAVVNTYRSEPPRRRATRYPDPDIETDIDPGI
jgi:uncharacterized protein YoxC